MLRTTSLLAATLGFAMPAASQTTDARIDALETQLQDQQARIDELKGDTSGRLSTGVGGIDLTFGGQVNAMVLRADQGPNGQTFIADNDGSGSRLEVQAETTMGEGLSAGLLIVVSAEVNSSDEIDFGSTGDGADESGPLGDFRQANFHIESDRFGRISLGQGDTAAEDTAHVDLSGTGFAGAGSDVDDVAGGLRFTADDGTDLAALDGFFDMQDGSRAVRALYVSPGFGGFSIAVSGAGSPSGSDGDDDLDGSGLQPAIALNYADEFGFGEIEAALSWRSEILDDDGKNTFLAGSASVLLASGFNATVAASRGDIEAQAEDPTAYFVKLGYLDEFFEIGETRVSVDYFQGENAAGFGGPGGALVEATSWGLFAVQQIARINTEAYLGMRRYGLDGVHADGTERGVDDLTAILAGARIRF